MFGRLLGWYAIYNLHFGAALMEFCQVQNPLCVQVLRSILAALLYGTRAVGSAKLYGMVQGMEIRNFRSYTADGHHVGHGPHSSLLWLCCKFTDKSVSKIILKICQYLAKLEAKIVTPFFRARCVNKLGLLVKYCP